MATTFTKEELRNRLTPMQYQVTQESSTERPFTGKYNKFYEKGVYRCIVCHEDLFTSDTKYDSGCGWPAFNDVLEQGKVTLHKDTSISGEKIKAIARCFCKIHLINRDTVSQHKLSQSQLCITVYCIMYMNPHLSFAISAVMTTMCPF